jgi:ribosomal protein L9
MAKYSAEQLITQRGSVSIEIQTLLTEKTSGYGIIVDELNLTNFDFSAEFNAAIEAKQVAEQNKIKANTEKEQRVIEAEAAASEKTIAANAEAEARKAIAEAEAEAMRVKAEAEAEAMRVKAEAEAEANKKRLEGQVITMTAKAGQGGRLFGSVTSKEIANVLKTQYSLNIDKRKIVLDQDIKAFGTYNCEVKLYTGISASVKVMVKEQE